MVKDKMPLYKRQKLNNEVVEVDLLQIISEAEDELQVSEKTTKSTSITSVEEVFEMYEKKKSQFCMVLQVCHMEVPKYKYTEKQLVHIYLSNKSTNFVPQVFESFSDRLANILQDKKLTKTLSKKLIRLTIWDASIDDCKGKFSLGNIIIVKRFTNLNTFRDLLQCNCTLDQVTMI